MHRKTFSPENEVGVSLVKDGRRATISKNLPPLGALPKDGFVRQSQLVPHIIPISPATLWRWVKAGTFPAPVKLSAMITAWKVADVREWLESQLAAA